MNAAIIREFRAADGADVRALADPEIGQSRYRSTWRAAVDAVLGRTDPDSHALVAMAGDTLAGVAIYGGIAGSEGAGRLQLIVTELRSRRAGIAMRLVEASLDALRRGGSRVAFVELPDDSTLHGASALLHRCGFHIESRVGDFFRDGVDLIVLRRELR